MMKTFFILSLPLSRTAWLANFLTYENSFCFHEGLLHVPSPHHLDYLFERTHKPIVGNSDCGNVLFLDEIYDVFPDSKFVIIERPYRDVISSMHQMGERFCDDQYVRKAQRLLDTAKTYFNPLVVPFHQLNHENCRRIWQHCVGTAFDSLRWQMLDGINVQVDPVKKLDQIDSSHTNISMLMEGLH